MSSEKLAPFKVYAHNKNLVVKYYDNGPSDVLDCAFCHWCGKMDLNDEDAFPTGEYRCPACKSKLIRMRPRDLG